MADLKREFIIHRHDKEYVLYAGLLDAAHQLGLKEISTELLQIPTADNGHTAIVRATVQIAGGLYTGIADARPDNVNRAMANALIRMAETRAKARALRDAVNVTAELLEDAAPEDQQGHNGQLDGRPPQQYTTDDHPQAATRTIDDARQDAREAHDLAVAQALGNATPPDYTNLDACKQYARHLYAALKAGGTVPPPHPTSDNLASWQAYCRALEQHFKRKPAPAKQGEWPAKETR